MSIKWYYFSDTNAPAGEIETALNKKQFTLKSTNNVESLHPHLIASDQSIVFLKANSIINVYTLCRDLSIRYPHVYIILVVPDNMENVKKAMQARASDILRVSYTTEELNEAIIQARKYMEHRAEKENVYSVVTGQNKVITVCNPKGGVGRTTLTVNLALAFARQGKKVAIIDSNIQFGEVAMYLNLKPKRTIYEWTKEAYGRSSYSVDQYMTSYENKISVLAAPLRPEFFEGITEEHIKTAIEEAKNLFDVVLIDTPAQLSEIHMCCLELSDELLLITTNDISTIRISKLYLDTLDTVNLKDKVKVIINKYTKSKNLDQSKIKEILTIESFLTMPSQDNIAIPSVEIGQPFVLSNPRSLLSKSICLLAEKLTAVDAPLTSKKKTKRWLVLSK